MLNIHLSCWKCWRNWTKALNKPLVRHLSVWFSVGVKVGLEFLHLNHRVHLVVPTTPQLPSPFLITSAEYCWDLFLHFDFNTLYIQFIITTVCFEIIWFRSIVQNYWLHLFKRDQNCILATCEASTSWLKHCPRFSHGLAKISACLCGWTKPVSCEFRAQFAASSHWSPVETTVWLYLHRSLQLGCLVSSFFQRLWLRCESRQGSRDLYSVYRRFFIISRPALEHKASYCKMHPFTNQWNGFLEIYLTSSRCSCGLHELSTYMMGWIDFCAHSLFCT